MRKFLLFLVLVISTSTSIARQGRVITGLVTDQTTKEPLIGVSISIKGKNLGAVSDRDGKFSVRIGQEENAVLIFKYIGYLAEEITVGTKSFISVALKADSKSINEVVVIGYGTVQKKDLSTSVGSVNIADINKAPVRSFDEALAGRVAGVTVTSTDGQPGAQSNITIRGANSITQDNSPLYVIDGFPVEGYDNNLLNTQEIESIDVLKDAAATAIYGARAANGVIMITTKKGKAGDAVITFSTTLSETKNIKTMDLMNTYEYVKYQIERDTITGSALNPTPKYYLLTTPKLTLGDYKNVQATDWQSPFFQTGGLQDYNLAIRGGNKQTLYSVSGSLNKQDGTIINTSYERYQGRITLDQTFNKWAKAGVNANYSYLKQAGNSVGASTNSGTTNVMYSVWGSSPTAENTNDNAIDETTASANDYKYNPVLNQQNMVRDNMTNNLNVNTYSEFALLPSLKLRVTGIVSNNILTNEVFNNSLTYYGNPVTIAGKANGVNGSTLTIKVFNWTNENTLTWSKIYAKKHSINVLTGFTQQGNESSVYGYGATFLPNESLGLAGLDEGTLNPAATRSAKSSWTAASFLGRVKYNFRSKYYVDLSYRADGSSKFSEENHWSLFPSASAAWRFKQENWLKNVGAISDGKLRFSYGLTGNNRVGDFSYLSTSSLPANLSYSFNNTYITSVIPGYNAGDTRTYSIGNPDLKWETTGQFDTGLDISFLNNKLSITADAYLKTTKDLLLYADIPTSSGYNRAFLNIGKVENKGVELTLNSTNLSSKNFKWTSNFNIAFNRNKVLALARDQEALTTAVKWDNNYQSTPAYIAKVGSSLGQMYGFIWDGNYQYEDFNISSNGTYVLKDNIAGNGNTRSNIQPGDIKYRDLNGDNTISAADYTVIGNGMPIHTGGFGNNFTYKDFDLNVFFQWSYGNQIQNTNRLVFEGNGLNKTFLQQFASYENRWTPENTTAENYRVGGFYGGGYSSRTVEDGSYLRLKTVSVGYNLPKSLLKTAHIKSLRLYASAQNLLTWTNYSGLDPEVSSYNSALTAGFDYSSYPRGRTLAIGLNLSF